MYLEGGGHGPRPVSLSAPLCPASRLGLPPDFRRTLRWAAEVLPSCLALSPLPSSGTVLQSPVHGQIHTPPEVVLVSLPTRTRGLRLPPERPLLLPGPSHEGPPSFGAQPASQRVDPCLLEDGRLTNPRLTAQTDPCLVQMPAADPLCPSLPRFACKLRQPEGGSGILRRPSWDVVTRFAHSCRPRQDRGSPGSPEETVGALGLLEPRAVAQRSRVSAPL